MIARVLFDSLWQGAAIVAIAYIVVGNVSRRNATTRYAVWFAALLSLIAVPLLTNFSNAGALLLAAVQPRAVTGGWVISLLPAQSMVRGSAALFISAAQWMAIAWDAGVGFCLLRLGASVVRIQRIRRNATILSNERSDVLISQEVAIPVAVGFIKPAIVVPKTLLERLAPTDLERIIEHERAHIARHDVAGNLVQRLVEAVLFFNPWVYLVSRNLVLEREASCDHWAVWKTGGADEYAACLASLARGLMRSRSPLATPSALGSRNALVERIERLAATASRPMTLNYSVIGGIIVLFTILTLALEAFSPALAFAPAGSNAAPASAGGGFVAAACTTPNVDAAVTYAAEPKMPHGVNVKGSPVEAIVAVTVASNGHVTGAKVWKSSGNAEIDQAVLNAARQSKYSPKLVNCEPVQGTYLFRADFAPDSH
jgi:TonB family protein